MDYRLEELELIINDLRAVWINPDLEVTVDFSLTEEAIQRKLSERGER